MSSVILGDKQTELEHLLSTFIKAYPPSDDGQRHIQLYKVGREVGQKNYEELVAAAERGDDITDGVLLHLLPHVDSSGNRERGAWIHIAPAINADIKMWFEGAKWTSPDDWPRISKAILAFTKRCVNHPEELSEACQEFAQLPCSKGFQSGMLSPILNALRPDEFLLINNKSRTVINYFCGTDHRQTLEDYPAANETAQQLIEEIKPTIDNLKGGLELRNSDFFDMFCHWLVAVKKYAFTEPKYWKVAPGREAMYWEKCRDGGFMAVGWTELGDLSGLSKAEYEARRDRAIAENPTWTKTGANQAWQFSRIKEGDIIVANRGIHEVLGIGTVIGPYQFVEGEHHGHRLPVRWDDTTTRLVEENGWRKTLVKLNRDKFEAIKKAPKKTKNGGSGTGHINPVLSLTTLADETGMEESQLTKWVNAIERKGQAILYGPPGTGKTYVAEYLSKHLIGGGDGFAEIVQFHPAYAYEDFIQGIRPMTNDGGQLRYPMVPGRFLDFCRRAAEKKGRCVLIVDEINRANLSRVFGELMYLLEYRNRTVPLAGGGSLEVPQNVRLLGTMNTADRSIALVDHALRRRFAFLALYPDYDILSAYHENTGFSVDGLALVLKRLNKVIGDRHYEVGITFFLREDLDIQIEDIWSMEIEPYLEEYFFDQPDKAAQFGWDKVKEEIGL